MILWCIMDAISVKLCMWCAMHKYCLWTALFKWAKRKRLPKSRSAQSIVDLTQVLHWHLVLSLSCRARREHWVFTKLLSMVPHLLERLMESSKEESMMICDLVCLISKFYFNKLWPLLEHIGDPKGYIYCPIRWHEEFKGCCPGLDSSTRLAFASTPFLEHQDQLRVPPSCYGHSSLPCWCELEWCWVCLPSNWQLPPSLSYSHSVCKRLASGELAVRGMEISGPCWFTQIKSMMKMNLGRGFSETSC